MFPLVGWGTFQKIRFSMAADGTWKAKLQKKCHAKLYDPKLFLPMPLQTNHVLLVKIEGPVWYTIYHHRNLLLKGFLHPLY
jgi:hypothetical protein